MANRIKKGDLVVVTAGKDKGKQGEIVRVDGDRVVVAKYTGTEIKCDGREYTIVRNDDILAIVE